VNARLEPLVRVVRGLRRRAALALRGEPDATVAPPPEPDASSAAGLYRWCLDHDPDASARPHYLWGVLQAASEARNLSLTEIAAIEFGVAGGNGILALEQAASAAERLLGVTVRVFGFDAGIGMPAPKDHRDVPWAVKPGYFVMDTEALTRRLTRARLVLGPVAETLSAWMGEHQPPVGFVAFDLDYYSSTVDAFSLFDGPPNAALPRVVCYFDDLFGYGWTDFNGERAAIADFNASHDERKISPVYGLKYELPDSDWRRPWPEQIYVAHLFDHPRYDEFVYEFPTAWLDAHQLHDRRD
jgi:hypothetical protein